MAVMLALHSGPFPLPKALSALSGLSDIIGPKATVFLAGFATWTLCGLASLSPVVEALARAREDASR